MITKGLKFPRDKRFVRALHLLLFRSQTTLNLFYISENHCSRRYEGTVPTLHLVFCVPCLSQEALCNAPESLGSTLFF
jgi:hypothetical protein